MEELTGIAGAAPRKAVLEADPGVMPQDRDAMSAHVRGPTYNVKAALMTLQRGVSLYRSRTGVLLTVQEDADTGFLAIPPQKYPIASSQEPKDFHCPVFPRPDNSCTASPYRSYAK